MPDESGRMSDLETKFHRFEPGQALAEGMVVSGYASVFGLRDQGGDIVAPGAYAASLARMKAAGTRVRMLWQHDPAQPIGVWDQVHEDARGLWVKGRLLDEVARGREAAALLAAGAVDGLSIGYRTLRAEKQAGGRVLRELDLWEVSLVTFPMQAQARIAAKSGGIGVGQMARIAQALQSARHALRG